MKTSIKTALNSFFTKLLLALGIGMTPPAEAATIWNGPATNFTNVIASDQDRLTPNVWITRGSAQGIYNAKKEAGFSHFLSPADTEWADGTTANYSSLAYKDWNTWAKGVHTGPPATVGVNAVAHLISEDIYLDVRFTSWGGPGGGFSWQRSTPAPANAPPSVTITNPANGGTFTAGLPITISADASDSDGTVTNVQFFDGAISLGSVAASPFSLTTTLYTGAHLLSAVATDNSGASTTSVIVTNTGATVVITNPIAARIPKGDLTIELKPVADGMISPLGMAVPDDGSGRMFVYDQAGVVYVVTAAGRSPTPLLDVRTRLMNIAGGYDERGLLGLAVHTNFAQYPLLYTYTSEPTNGPADFPTLPGTTNNHQSVIAEWRISAGNSNAVDVGSRREILRVDEPQSNHNGGAMRFGPDGLLYVTVGDGGQANDVGAGHVAGGNAQDLDQILGKMIRIDVDGTNSANGKYGIPTSNPFVGTAGLGEIYACGLRNPFCFSFDRGTGQLYLADVGQNKVEEVDLIIPGGNYGWNVREGSFWFDSASGNVVTAPVRPPPPGMMDPIAQYDHDDGAAIIGGYVYRGTALPALEGRYVFGDWGVFGSPAGRLFYLDTGAVIKEFRLGLEERSLGLFVKGFGEGPTGELYVFATKQQGPAAFTGAMYKIVPAPASALAITGQSVVNNTNLQNTWSGGLGPFVQQRKAVIDEPAWMNEAFVAGNTTTVPLRGAAGFFRELDTAGQAAVPFTAQLSGANERPAPLVNSASGFGIFRLEGNSLTLTITYTGLSGTPTAAHIHGPSTAANSGSVLIDLKPYHNGVYSSTNGSFSGTLVLTDAQKALVMAGLTYVNVHTTANPGGEMRGQIAPVLMHASVSGVYENPPAGSGARGFGTFMLIGDQLTFNLRYAGLSSAATGAHIHGSAPIGQSAGVQIDLSPYNGGSWGNSGMVAGSVTLTAAQLAMVIDGLTYVNFHTASKPGGEIRGQIVAQSTAVPLSASVSGLNERPNALTNTATGLGLFSLEGNQLAFNITYGGLSGPATAAHIHGAANSSGTAGVQIDLSPYNGGGFGTGGILFGVVTLTPAQRAVILNGQAYVNFHTAANPGGEARGNIATVLLTAGATGSAERATPVATTGTALGQFMLLGTRLTLSVVYKDLFSPAVASHIHAPAAASANAGVVLDLAPFNGGSYGPFGALSGSTILSAAVVNNLLDGLGYINFHTAGYSGGEIRGQILK